MIPTALKRLPPLAASLFALPGGAWLGFSSCGGYVWHAQAILVGLVVSLALTILIPAPVLASWFRRTLFVCSIQILFALAGAVGSAFYPENPHSIGEFLQLVLSVFFGEGTSC